MDNPLVPTPPIGITRGLIRQRDKMHVGSIFLNRDVDDEFADPGTGGASRLAHPARRRAGGDPGAGRGDLPAADLDGGADG